MEEVIRHQLEKSAQLKMNVAREQCSKIAKIAHKIIHCYRYKGKVILFGNGGSASDAEHLAAELVGRFKKESTSLPALALSANTSVLTALGNDYGFDTVFANQIKAFAASKDIVIGLSTSGNSLNVLKAVKEAKAIGATTIAFTGGSGGKLKHLVDIAFIAPSSDVPRVQEIHITVGHIICGLVKDALLNEK